ncbi:WAT1-related protein At3g45870-like isoform X3 [Phalaenopsis equestris]|uniref:WAT1-related protein At3g45870-like isoform X3 n=1 Tax=Phalaenopsis equestris TaxID=78828 RepID=UPI0009E580F8|nr:WAT1-related protein At3g45870-like isoform X3 [Phalaenopsis equestris]
MDLVRQVAGGRALAWKAYLAMVLVQVIYGGFHVITKVALNVGMNQIVFCIFRDLLGFFILAPIAFVRDRGIRPPLTSQLLLSFLFLGLTGCCLLLVLDTQIQLMLLLFSHQFQFLHSSWQQLWVMLIYRGPAIFGNGVDATLSEMIMGTQSEHVRQLRPNLLKFQIGTWHIGVLCLIGNCVCMAAFLVLQAPVLVKYPATLSLTAYTYFFGTVMMVLSGLCTSRNSTDWMLTKSEIIAILYSGVFSSALNYGLITWSNTIIGPALVALFMPLQPAMSAFLSAIFIGSSIFLGSIVGGFLIIAGLYLVTWARYAESEEAKAKSCEDLISEPLL